MNKSLRFAVGLPLLATLAYAQQGSAEEAYRALKTDAVWVSPQYNGNLDASAIRVKADSLKPYSLRVLVVPQLGQKWTKNGQEQRGSYAQYLTKNLGLGDQTIAVVLTKRGITGYNSKVSQDTLRRLNSDAASIAKSGDLTGGVTTLAQTIHDEAINAPTTRTGTTSAPAAVATEQASGGSSFLGLFACLAIPVALIAGVVAIIKKASIGQSKNQATAVKNKAVEAVSYLDSYDGLIDDPTDASAIRQYRDRMAQNLDEGLSMLNSAKKQSEFEAARRQFALVLTDFESAKQYVDKSTDGTGIAFKIPPIVDTQRAPMFEPVPGVSYFSSQPADNLVPVEMNFGGQRRTVMVTPAERDQMMNGQMPQLRGMQQNGGFTPWYGVQGYDPHRDYNSNNFLWNLMAINAVSNMFSPHYGYGWGGGLFGGGGWGGGYGYNDHTTIINNYGNDNNSNGGFDFGNGGGDFGGNDSGGGFDFGGGGGDFGGGGGDFGGGGGDF